jgi:hypothetical protein
MNFVIVTKLRSRKPIVNGIWTLTFKIIGQQYLVVVYKQQKQNKITIIDNTDSHGKHLVLIIPPLLFILRKTKITI